MATRATAVRVDAAPEPEKHPKGLYVLFAAEMWERFSFYTMVSMFALYLRDPVEGFAWTAAQASTLYANYMMFVYVSPLIGGWIADRKLGYRRAVMLGGFFFMAGHLLLSIRSLAFVYAALTCLVIGNGFFKPNVSTMVGNLYPTAAASRIAPTTSSTWASTSGRFSRRSSRPSCRRGSASTRRSPSPPSGW